MFSALGVLFLCVGSGAMAYWNVLGKFTDIAERVTRTETFIEMLGMESFTKLHRDDNAYGLDHYVNKYVEHNYDLPMEDWRTVLAICSQRLETNTGGTDTPYFIMVKALATHKLMACQDCSYRRNAA